MLSNFAVDLVRSASRQVKVNDKYIEYALLRRDILTAAKLRSENERLRKHFLEKFSIIID
jgi:hypothetical protein